MRCRAVATEKTHSLREKRERESRKCISSCCGKAVEEAVQGRALHTHFTHSTTVHSRMCTQYTLYTAPQYKAEYPLRITSLPTTPSHATPLVQVLQADNIPEEWGWGKSRIFAEPPEGGKKSRNRLFEGVNRVVCRPSPLKVIGVNRLFSRC